MNAFSDISLGDLYLAYRKAKSDAYYENTHFHALAYVRYERHLDLNLRRLRTRLRHEDWSSDTTFLGGYVYAPKSVANSDDPIEDGGLFYRFLDPLEEWHRRARKRGGTRAEAVFRLMIVPTVDFQIISALWLMLVGHVYDGVLDSSVCYGNRLRRKRPTSEKTNIGEINLDCNGLFPPYFSGYSRWRENGLLAMEDSLKEGQRILAITMDVRSFYHSVSPRFLVRKSFRIAWHTTNAIPTQVHETAYKRS